MKLTALALASVLLTGCISFPRSITTNCDHLPSPLPPGAPSTIASPTLTEINWLPDGTGLIDPGPDYSTDQVERIEVSVVLTIGDYRAYVEWTLDAHRALKSQALWIETCKGEAE